MPGWRHWSSTSDCTSVLHLANRVACERQRVSIDATQRVSHALGLDGSRRERGETRGHPIEVRADPRADRDRWNDVVRSGMELLEVLWQVASNRPLGEHASRGNETGQGLFARPSHQPFILRVNQQAALILTNAASLHACTFACIDRACSLS